MFGKSKLGHLKFLNAIFTLVSKNNCPHRENNIPLVVTMFASVPGRR